MDKDFSNFTSKAISAHEQSHGTFSQELDTHRFNWAATCELHSVTDHQRREWTYRLKKVECDKHGDPRRVIVTCSAEYTVPGKFLPRPVWRIGDKSFDEWCPVGSRCMPVFLMNKAGGGPEEELGCVDDRDIVQQTITPGHNTAQPGEEDVHCSLSLQLPGNHLHTGPHHQPMDFILTEEVRNLDGTPFNAPELSIRDDTTYLGKIARALRYDASVASTLVEIGVHRGRLQQRRYEFCVKLPPKMATSVVFAYTYIQLPRRDIRIPPRLDQRTEEITVS